MNAGVGAVLLLALTATLSLVVWLVEELSACRQRCARLSRALDAAQGCASARPAGLRPAPGFWDEGGPHARFFLQPPRHPVPGSGLAAVTAEQLVAEAYTAIYRETPADPTAQEVINE